MFSFRSIFPYFLFLLAVVAVSVMTACNNDIQNTDDRSIGQKGIYFSVAINVPETTDSIIENNSLQKADVRRRIAPTGGKTGDGAENGQTSENTISDISVFFYRSSSLNQAIANDELISSSVYFESSDILAGNVTKTQKVDIPKGVYHVLVVVNAGDITPLFNTSSKVKDVCDFIQKSAWIETGGYFSNFVMSTSKDKSINLSGITTAASPATIQVDIERVAARVDVIPSNSSGLLKNNYLVKNSSGITTGRVVIRKIKLINRLTAGSYLCKRVVGNMSGATPVYLGDEDPSTGGAQTNYVLDPWSIVKTKLNLSGLQFNVLSGGTGVDLASSLFSDYFNSSYSFNVQDVVKSANLTVGGEDFYILGYTLENTTDKSYQLNGYSTGTMFETTYIPYKITSYDAVSRTNVVLDNLDEISFLAYDNGNIICNSLESVEFAFLKNSQPPSDFFVQTFTTANTWQQVSDFSNRIKDDDLLGFKAFLFNKMTGKSMSDHLTESLSWNIFVLSTYGYSISAGVISANQNGKNTRAILSNLGISYYNNGLCYYPYWIRHSNDGTVESSIMEFGIVRNNIYKLKVVSFSGLGKTLPFEPGKDDPGRQNDNSYINISLNVRPWRLISHPDIVL